VLSLALFSESEENGGETLVEWVEEGGCILLSIGVEVVWGGKRIGISSGEVKYMFIAASTELNKKNNQKSHFHHTTLTFCNDWVAHGREQN
jgi:hypothetical protein